MNTVGTPLLWGGFAVVVVIMLAIDLLLQGRRGAHSMTMRQAAGWSILWVTLSLLFNAAFWWYLVQTEGRAVADPQALAFLTGYLIEKALAVDNVFVWLMLFSYFAVPPALQRRVLVYGVLGAIVLRTIMIFAGSWLISQFEWLLYVFGAFLLFTGVKMALAKEDDSGIGDKPLVRWIRNHLRMTDKIEGERFFTRQNGVLYATPLLLVLILVELSDVIFAVDSIPAIFAVTTDPFIVLTSNLFAILGLRAMYFLLAGVAERFSMLKYGLSVILVFIGIKMLIVDFYHIPIGISLGVVGGILTLTLLINAWVNKQHDKKKQLQYGLNGRVKTLFIRPATFSAYYSYSCHKIVNIQLKNKISAQVTAFYPSPIAFFPYTQPGKHLFTSGHKRDQ